MGSVYNYLLVRKMTKDNSDLFIKADKTANCYIMKPSEHESLLEKNILKSYKKVPKLEATEKQNK